MDMALRDQPYLPLYVQDFLTDEKLAECSASATGVYIRLLCLMHKSESYGSILLRQKHQQNDDQIRNFATMLGKVMPFDTDIIYSGLHELLEENVVQLIGNELSQKRMIYDGNLSLTRSGTGSLGGKKTKENREKFGVAKNAANTESEYENENEVLNTLHNKKEISIEFEFFWVLYDKKVGSKDKLVKKWAALTDQERSDAINHVPKYKLAQPDKKFRKDPATYLNNKSWNDEIISSAPKNGHRGFLEVPAGIDYAKMNQK
jgi:hypothetical protein